jgi:hypothetical protein
MTSPTLLAATWSEGLFVVEGTDCHHELQGQSVRGLSSDQRGNCLALVDGHSLRRRHADGSWQVLAEADQDLSCCLTVGGDLWVGTDDAQLLRLGEDGQLQEVPPFDAVPGRETWYAGTAVINGQVVGPPLGIRSLTATADGQVLLVNVHVGGIPRSADYARSWQPTLGVDEDVHEVCAHPSDPQLVVAAAATGLCISRDGGTTWSIEQEGLHATYCSAVGFAGDRILISAAEDHFSAEAAIYQRPISGSGPLRPIEGGLPRWISGIADTGCIASRGDHIALADRAGNLYRSEDAGQTWRRSRENLPRTSSLLIP